MERKQFWPNKRRDEIYATTEISFFLFSVFHFRDFERIMGSIYKIRGKHRDRGFVSSSVYPCGNEKRGRAICDRIRGPVRYTSD